MWLPFRATCKTAIRTLLLCTDQVKRMVLITRNNLPLKCSNSNNMSFIVLMYIFMPQQHIGSITTDLYVSANANDVVFELG